MHTFYVPRNQFNEQIATIVGSEHHYLRNVLRLGLGKTIRLIDGAGNIYSASIVKSNSESTGARIERWEYQEKIYPSITLFQALPKHDKMEWILQKTTELGVNRIVPIITERSLQKPSNNKLERWQRIVLSATKQCGRAWIPEINEIQTLQDCLNTIRAYECTLLFWEKESDKHIQSILRRRTELKSIALIVGPEGGFTDNEVKEQIDKGCIPVKVGSSILRTETAAVAGVAMLNYEYKL